MVLFATICAVTSLVLTGVSFVGSAINFGIYASTIIPFISSIPEYLGNYFMAIGAFLPSYIIAPFFAMLGILVCYLICHLFAQFISNIPS